MSAIDEAIADAETAANTAAPIAPQQPQAQQPMTGQVMPPQGTAMPEGVWLLNNQVVPAGTMGATFYPAPQQAAPAPESAAVPAQYAAAPGANVPAPMGAAGLPATSDYGQAGQTLTMDDMDSGLLVDFWLTVNEYGLILEKEKKNLFTEMLVEIDLTQSKGFVPKISIKAGNPAQYWSTTDNVNSDKPGVSWAMAQQQAKAIDPKAFTFRSADILMTLVEDIEGSQKKGYKAGDAIGLSLSTTNWKNWSHFYNKAKDRGLVGQVVKVKIGSEERSNKSDNVWGVVTFELVED